MITEIWVDTFFDGYQVSNLGRVRSLDRIVKGREWHGKGHTQKRKGQILKQRIYRRYYSVGLKINAKDYLKRVHRLVAMAFIPNPDNKREVNHINGNKLDNRAENLEWATCSENHKHAFENGLKDQKGEKNNGGKLNEMQVRIIRKMKGDMLYKEIGEYFNITESNVGLILRNKSWVL